MPPQQPGAQSIDAFLCVLRALFGFSNQMQVWYKHVGNCGACTRYARCIELLWDFADEMKIKLERTDDPTKLADELFDKMRLA